MARADSDVSTSGYSSTVRKTTVVTPETITKNDLTGPVFYYFGEAAPGSATSAAVWQVERVTITTGDSVLADGNPNYDNIWDNRVTLDYS